MTPDRNSDIKRSKLMYSHYIKLQQWKMLDFVILLENNSRSGLVRRCFRALYSKCNDKWIKSTMTHSLTK